MRKGRCRKRSILPDQNAFTWESSDKRFQYLGLGDWLQYQTVCYLEFWELQTQWRVPDWEE